MLETINKGKKCRCIGCEYDAFCKGVCKAHYEQIRKYGKPMGAIIPHIKARGGITKKYPNEYRAWNLMKRRCYNHNDRSYRNYGGRGIKVCDRWINSFQNFLEDMGCKPDGCSLDRINPDKDYSPENCRWATNRQQQRNRRNNRREPCIVEWEGKYYVQVEKNGVHRRRLCDTLELARSVRDAFDKELDEIWS